MRPANPRAALVLLLLCAPAAHAADLRGSPRSMINQHGVAKAEGFTFSRSASQIESLAERGKLEPVLGNADYVVSAQVVHRYARPEVKLLVERLAAQYREATGERLVVTSLVRPADGQPSNAHQLSVHPAGIAVDLRVPAKAESRQWLEQALLGLERAGVLDVTREFRPPHYHVAVFPAPYRAYVERRLAVEAAEAARRGAAPASAEASVTVADADPAEAEDATLVAGFGATELHDDAAAGWGLANLLLTGFAVGLATAGWRWRRRTT